MGRLWQSEDRDGVTRLRTHALHPRRGSLAIALTVLRARAASLDVLLAGAQSVLTTSGGKRPH
jgi:hypothetical protein